MLYLIKSYGSGGQSILKLGFTDNVNDGINHYFYYNPYIEILSIREGDLMLESLFHIYLKFLGYDFKMKGKLEEWFKDIPEVRQLFHISRETLERRIWRSRGKIFSSMKSNYEYGLFEYLYQKHKDSFEGEKYILDNNKNPKKTKALSIDVKFWKSYQKKNPGGRNNI